MRVIPMRVGPEEIRTQRSAKYLGVTLEDKLTFAEQIRNASTKAATVTAALSRLMPNIGCPATWKAEALDGDDPVHLAL